MSTEHKSMVKSGLSQLPLEGLVRARHRCKIEPEKIQLDGGICHIDNGTY